MPLSETPIVTVPGDVVESSGGTSATRTWGGTCSRRNLSPFPTRFNNNCPIWVASASMLGSRAEMGPCAVVENEQATILITSRKMPPMDLGQLHSQGVRPEEATYVVVKAAVSHRDAYGPIARASFNVDSAGLCTSNLERLPYQKIGGKTIALP